MSTTREEDVARTTSVKARRERGPSARLTGPVLGFLLLALSSGLPSGPISGQEGAADPEPDRLTVTPIYTNLYPTGELERVEEGTWGVDPSFGFGVRLGWRVSDRLVVEAGAFRAPTELSLAAADLEAAFDVDLDVATGGASYFLGPSGWTVRPFVSAAAGVKHYDGAPPLDGLGETDLTLAAGGGAAVRTGGIVDVTVRLTDYVSEFDVSALSGEFEGTPLQNDIVLEVGLQVGVL